MLLPLIRDLVQHKNHANAELLRAILAHEHASADPELRKLLHHIIVANRFWLSLFLSDSFDVDKESQIPESMRDVARLYQETHDREREWLGGLSESDLQRRVQTPWIPDRTFSVSEAAMQVCLHSQGHRSQCATRLRGLGGEPPPLDFILWLRDRPDAEGL